MGVGMKNAMEKIAAAIEAAGPSFAVDLSTTDLAAICGAGAGAKTLADVVTALGDPATAAEICGAGGAAKTLADVVTALGDPATAAEICGAGGAAKTLADVVTALGDPATAAEICGAGGAAKTLADVVTALGDPATAAEVTAALEAVLKSGTDTAIAQLVAIAGTALPVKGTDAAGADGYVTVLTTPVGRVCRRIRIYCETKAAVISLDGGTTDHLHIEPGMQVILDGLKIPAESAVQAKNAAAGENYANLSIAVW